MPAEGAGDGGSCTLPRKGNNFPALAATTCSVATVKIHGQTQSSSESSVSGTNSSTSRQRRARLAAARIAAARVALAEARLAEIEANEDLVDDASADSIGRRNDDVLSDLDNDASYLQAQAENAYGQPISPTNLSERTGSASTPTPSIYDDVRQRVGNTTQNDVFFLDNRGDGDGGGGAGGGWSSQAAPATPGGDLPVDTSDLSSPAPAPAGDDDIPF